MKILDNDQAPQPLYDFRIVADLSIADPRTAASLNARDRSVHGTFSRRIANRGDEE